MFAPWAPVTITLSGGMVAADVLPPLPPATTRALGFAFAPPQARSAKTAASSTSALAPAAAATTGRTSLTSEFGFGLGGSIQEEEIDEDEDGGEGDEGASAVGSDSQSDASPRSDRGGGVSGAGVGVGDGEAASFEAETTTAAASPGLRLTVLEEYKCAIKGSEVKSQLLGLVRLQNTAAAAGGFGDGLRVELELRDCPARDPLVFNPSLEHTAAASGCLVFSGFPSSLSSSSPSPSSSSSSSSTPVDAPAPTVLLKYRSDGFALLPPSVKVKAGVKSATASFVVLQVDVALNRAAALFAAKRAAVAEVKLSLKALGRLGVLDARGKQAESFSFVWDADRVTAVWTAAAAANASGAGQGAVAVLCFMVRAELAGGGGGSGSGGGDGADGGLDALRGAAFPVNVALRVPEHLTSAATVVATCAGAAIACDYTSRVEFSFL